MKNPLLNELLTRFAGIVFNEDENIELINQALTLGLIEEVSFDFYDKRTYRMTQKGLENIEQLFSTQE